MSFLRFIGIIISLALLLTNCSPKISQMDYDRKNYEYEQLKVRYDLLKGEVEGNTEKGVATTTTKVAKEVNIKDYEELQNNYEELIRQNKALENAYTDMHKQQEVSNTAIPPGTISMRTYNDLKAEKEALQAEYNALEIRYNALKSIDPENSSSIQTAEMIEPTEINTALNVGKGGFEIEENSIELGTSIVQSASFSGLFFDFDSYDRTNDYLVLEIAVKNNSQTNLNTSWNADKIEITNKQNQTYIATSFRIGVDYADNVTRKLSKRIKDENMVFARFAFEDLPANFKQIKSLKFIVLIDGEERTVEFTQIDISNIEYN